MDLRSPVHLDFCQETLVDGSGEHITTVVVSVFADQVDAAGRSKELAISTEKHAEFLRNSVFHIHVHLALVHM